MQACAGETHVKISQEPFLYRNLQKNVAPQNEPERRHTFCASLSAETCQDFTRALCTEIYKKNTAPPGTQTHILCEPAQSLPASHLLGTCYLLDELRSTHTCSKYLRATYSHICVLSQCYMCLTYTVPTIHSNDTIHTIHTIHTLHTIHTIHTIRTLTIHTIPIIHTTHTIHMKHKYNTCHTYNTKHTCHTYHTYLT